MTFALRRSTGEPGLELSGAHAEIAAPRHGTIAWDAFDRAAYPAAPMADAADAWRMRAVQEYHSLALFTQLSSQVHLLGAPLDWSGAFARMIADEVRHTELCVRMAETLGAGEPASIEPQDLHLPLQGPTLRAHVRHAVVAAFCVGETLSGRMFRRCLRAATVPLAKGVVRAIVDDETFHGQFGWEAAALLMRPNGPTFEAERSSLVADLPGMFRHYRRLCAADPGEAWARNARAPEAEPDPNFGTLTLAGYARSFYDGMLEDVVPGLVAIGLHEAEGAWEAASRGPADPPR
jgi:hypothetical protein